MRFWSDAKAEQRSAFFASWLGWVLDAFDFTLLLLIMPQLQAEMGLSRGQLGDVVTATLLGRVIGGPLGGRLCDRFGRRWPMMVSLVLYALFDTLVAFSHTYGQLMVLRFLFGIGMGAEWSAGTALVMEHWPARTRGLASGLLQGSWAIGYFLAALCCRLIVPSFGWRPLFYLAALPALLALFVRARVHESPSFLREGGEGSLGELWRDRGLRRNLLVGSLVLGGGFFTYYSLATFYPLLLGGARGLSPSVVTLLVVLFNVGMLAGAVGCGLLSEQLGRRPAMALFSACAVPAALLYVLPHALWALCLGAVLGGVFGVGWTGATPSYLSEQFPTRVRAAGVGIAYHIGALCGALAPVLVPLLDRRGLGLEGAMALCAAAGGITVASAVWLGPERRGAPM